ncbi:MAG: hypothetical protein RIS88_1931 [Pseudomonadota bacterium]
MNETPAPETVDPERCPLCGGANACAIETQRRTGEAQPACWCTRVTFSAATLARVPPEARNRACLCARCADTATP